MHGPDGPEERTAWSDEQFANDMDALDMAEILADESRDDPDTWAEEDRADFEAHTPW